MTSTALADAHTSETPVGWPARLFSARGELASAIAAGALLLLGWILRAIPGLHAAAEVLIWTSLAIGMIHGLRAAADSLRNKAFDIDCLMVIGAAMAAYVGAPAEGALLLFLFVLSGALEGLAMARTRRAVEALHKLMPTKALRADASGAWAEVEPEVLAPGDRIKVLPGESIPADAMVTAGRSAVNQASLTGESLPRTVDEHDEVFAGTINVGNAFEARVTRPARESSLQKILNLVMVAQQQREPVQRLIDRLGQPYAISVVAASTAVLLIWWLVFNEPLLSDRGSGSTGGALYTAITLLVVMSPCAVVIATPTATLAAIARAARAGVLFKGGQAIERLARLRAVALDKTGTLTIGRPRVRQVMPIGWSDADELLAVAAGLEQDSTHPIAAAIREAASARSIQPTQATRTMFAPGQGVSGVFGVRHARLGTIEHAEELIPVCLRARTREVVQAMQANGAIATVIAWDGQAAVIAMQDEPRPGAENLVDDLHTLDIRPVVMLTGDNAATARRIAEELGIDRWEAQLLPEAKVDAVRRLKSDLQARFGPNAGVGMIGDGVNDAPVLSAADVSIAIGSIGSDAALESADIVLLGDDLGTVPWAVNLARRARLTISVNLGFALAAIVIMAVATVVGSRFGYHMPLWTGVLGHEGGTLLVVANSLLLLTLPGARRTPTPPARSGTNPCLPDRQVSRSMAFASSGVPAAARAGGAEGIFHP